MNPYELFGSDPKAETEGVELDFGSFKITIARAGGANRKFGRILDAKLKPHRRAIQTETLDPDLSHRLLVESYADAVVLGWEGVTDAKGKALAFTRENVVKLFSDLPDLFRQVQDEANRVANFRAQEVEEEKNG